MSLATRCTSCGTAFRLVQDQLKVSEGWVRCGRCNEVFNALEGLFDLAREPLVDSDAHSSEKAQTPEVESTVEPAGANLDPRPRAAESLCADAGELDDASGGEPIGDLLHEASSAVPERITSSEGGARAALRAPDGEVHPPALGSLLTRATHPAPNETAAEKHQHPASLDEEIDAHLFGARGGFRRKTVPGHLSERDRLDFTDARFDSDLLGDAEETEDAESDITTTRSSELPLESTVPPPEFLRRAETRARWHRPGIRTALGLSAACLVVLLVLQAGHHFRDEAAARWPSLQAMLTGWCTVAGCTLEAPRHISEISIENSALAKVSGAEAFRLGVTLRSRSSVPVAMPWIDLSLTDAGGRLVARRAIAVEQLEPTMRALPPGAEVALHAFLEARDGRVSGYTVEIFYP